MARTNPEESKPKLPTLLTVPEFAAAVRWRPNTVRQMIWLRRLPFLRIGRSIRIAQSTLDELIANAEVPALERSPKKRRPAPPRKPAALPSPRR